MDITLYFLFVLFPITLYLIPLLYLFWHIFPFSVDVYSFLQSSSYSSSEQPSPSDASISEIVEKSGANNSQGQGILRGVYAAKVCCVLSQKADELFHAAALRLSLPGLCNFFTELCKSSHTQVSSSKSEKEIEILYIEIIAF